MSTVAVPASAAEALEMLESAMEFLADADAADMPAEALADCLRGLERADAIEAAARGRFLEAFDAKNGHLADGRRNTRTWLVHCLRVTRGQAGEHKAIQALAREHQPLLAGLREQAVTTSVALQLARWTGSIPAEFREQAEEILVAAARAGADLRALAQICAEIRYRTAPPDPHDGNDKHLDRGLSLGTTLDGAGVIHGDLTPECGAMVQAVLDALSVPEGSGDLRTRPQRYHDALAEAMKRLLASDLLPPARADNAGRQDGADGQATGTDHVEQVLAMLEHQILGKILDVVSGPGGAASFLRRNMLGKGLNGPSLPLDVGQTDDIPVHLRRLVALRGQTCQFPGGCDQPAAGCEPHHVIHRRDGGRTSLANLKDYCWWHHHVVLHELGWTLTVRPDGTSQVQSPTGKIIRSHGPPPSPG
jgi:hypothetical protein